MCSADPLNQAWYKSDPGLAKLGIGDWMSRTGNKVDPMGVALQKSDIGVRTIKGMNHPRDRTVVASGPSYIDQDRQQGASTERSRQSIRSTAA